jgi:enterochelin esterase-like enzyme
VIVPFIDKTYPTIAASEGRLLVGFSKSGIGAVSLLLRHPDIFGRAGSWDAPLMEDKSRTEYYGSQENFMANYYIPALLARMAPTLSGKPARIAITGLGWGGTPGAHKEMERLGIPHYYNELPQGMHEWPSGWLAPLVEVLMAEDMAHPAWDATAPSRGATAPAGKREQCTPRAGLLEVGSTAS